jgi:hypothetical protein
MEELTLWVIQRVAKMPRAHRFTVGNRLTETCLDVTATLLDAGFSRDKRALLEVTPKLKQAGHRVELELGHFDGPALASSCSMSQPKKIRKSWALVSRGYG